MKHGSKHIYTLFSLLLSAGFIFASMAGMNVIFRAEESRLLSESGKTIVTSPVRAWEEAENNPEDIAGENPGRLTYTLTNGQLEEAVGSWNSRTGEIVHHPVVGQISMEEAILAGERWLTDMGIEESGQEADSVNATLGIPEPKGLPWQKELSRQNGLSRQLEPYYSFWTVRFSNRSMNAVLYINAVTGKVSGAEISLYRNLPDKFPVEKLGLFVELAGLRGNDTETVSDPDGTSAFLEIADSQMCAEMEFQHRQKGYFDLTTYGQGGADAGPDLYYNEYMTITFKLSVTED